MIVELSNLLVGFPGAANRSRCFTHVLNLAAKSIIRQYDLPKAQADVAMDEAAKELANLAADLELEEILTRGKEDAGGENDDDDDGWVDENAMLTDEERTELDVTVKPVRLMLVKVTWINQSQILANRKIEAPQTCIRCEELNDSPAPQVVLNTQRPQRIRVHDASRCHDTVELHFRYARLRDSISESDSNHHLKSWLQSSAIWAQQGGMENCGAAAWCFEGIIFNLFFLEVNLTNLKVFKDATMFFSQSKPNVDSVIPAMDYIDQQLTANALKPRYSASIKASIALGKKTLNRYYDMTDDSEIYRIAMGKLIYNFFCCIATWLYFRVLHPRHKLDYFRKAGWQKEWITAAHRIVRDEFERSYMTPVVEEDSDVASLDQSSVRLSVSGILFYLNNFYIGIDLKFKTFECILQPTISCSP
jgi:hypothetical protein